MTAAGPEDRFWGSPERTPGSGRRVERLTRRRFGTGVLGGVALLAGCTGSGTGGLSPSPTAEPTPEPTPTATPEPDPEARSNIEAATQSLIEVSHNFRVGLGVLDQSLAFIDFTTEHIYGWLDQAAGEIEAAEATATGPQLAQVDALWALFDWFSPLVDAMAAYDDGVDAMGRAEAYLDNGRFEDALDAYGRSRDAFDEALAFTDDAATAYPAIDLSPFGMAAAAELASERDAAARLAAAADGMGLLAAFYVDYFWGAERFLRGGTAMDTQDYGLALEEFQEAEDRFTAAHETSLAGESVAPDWLFERFALNTCSSDALVESSQHYQVAAEAGRDGDAEGAEAAEAAADAAFDDACSGL